MAISRTLAAVLLAGVLLVDGARKMKRRSEIVEEGCPAVKTQSNFSLDTFISKQWYAQQQAQTVYLPADSNNCVTAQYFLKPRATFLGWTIDVNNLAKFDSGEPRVGNLCASLDGSGDPAKLQVAPCFLPTFLAGPYWVLAHNEEEGYALISGGQPTTKTEGGCRTGTDTNNSGLWIFTRKAFPSDVLVAKVRDIAKAQGFDVSVLAPVNHKGCTGALYD